METVNLLIRSADNTRKILKEKVKGYKYTSNNIIKYEYETTLGKSTIYYHINTNHIIIKRTGESNIQLSIYEKIHSYFYYKNDVAKFEFLVLGNNIDFRKNKLRFSYSLFTNIDDLKKNKNIFNKIHMSIEEIT